MSNGVSFRDLAAVSGISEQRIARQIKKQIKRLVGTEYISVLREKDKFNKEELMVAYDRFLLGMSYRKIANKRNMGSGKIRLMVKRLENWTNTNRRRTTNKH